MRADVDPPDGDHDTDDERRPHETQGQAGHDDGADGRHHDHVPRREARPRGGHVAAAQPGTRLTGARSLPHLEEACQPPSEHALGQELQHHGAAHRQREPGVLRGPRDGQPHDRADHEVAELHRQPERPVEAVGEGVDRAEDALLDRADAGPPRTKDRRHEHQRTEPADDAGHRCHGRTLRAASAGDADARWPPAPRRGPQRLGGVAGYSATRGPMRAP